MDPHRVQIIYTALPNAIYFMKRNMEVVSFHPHKYGAISCEVREGMGGEKIEGCYVIEKPIYTLIVPEEYQKIDVSEKPGGTPNMVFIVPNEVAENCGEAIKKMYGNKMYSYIRVLTPDLKDTIIDEETKAIKFITKFIEY